ncbi:unnamed protein product [Alopecurus aequalis]
MPVLQGSLVEDRARFPPSGFDRPLLQLCQGLVWGGQRYASLFLAAAPRSAQAVSSPVRPPFFGGRVSVPYILSYPTPAVRCVPRVSWTDAASNRRKRRFVVLSLRGKAPVCVKGPPFSDEDIAWLKATEPTRSYYGGPEFACPHCQAVYWSAERCKRKSVSKGQPPVYNRCCRAGKISLPGFHDWPEPLKELLRFDGGAPSSHFLRLIRHYNSLFCFTSMGANIDRSINVGGAPYVFKMCGVVFHRIGTFLPTDGRDPQFAQLYIVNSADELRYRMNVFGEEGGDDEADPAIVQQLIHMLNVHNHLVQKYRFARERLRLSGSVDVAIHFFGDEGGFHGDRFSGPTGCEVAALIVGDLAPDRSRFDVVVEPTSGQLQEVSSLNPSLMALQYPLLFPHGDKGYHLGISYKRPSVESAASTTRRPSSTRRSEVSMLEYYCYYFHYKGNEPNPYTCCGRLSQQIIVNAYSCVEANRLAYHFFNQESLRSETYQGISDAMGEGSSTGKNLGVQYMLHSSFTGGPRYMIQNYQDGMALCREYGAPDLFVTFTCNPKWQEIVDALRFEPGQTPSDRPDISVRVFNMKFAEFLDAMKEGVLFGPIRALLRSLILPSIL